MFIDVHHHLLYGLDDGAESAEMMQKMLLAAETDGIDRVFATPHMIPGVEIFDWEKYRQRLREANAFCEENHLRLRVYPGAEIFYTQQTARLAERDELPTMLQGNKLLLVEFSPRETFETLREAAVKLGNQGYALIFAHIERYPCLRRKGRIESLRDDHYVNMQMNAATIIDRQGFFEDRWIDKVLENELIDFVGTDAHNLSTRRCRMSLCYKALCERHGKETADWLCFGHARELFDQAHFVGL